MADKEVHAMRFGPGKHLAGLTLMDGCVKPEEFDCMYFSGPELLTWIDPRTLCLL